MRRACPPVEAVLVLLPIGLAAVGPLLAGPIASTATPLQPPSAQHLLGTDALGRDVVQLVLRGGGSVVGLAGATLVLAYATGVPLALLVAARRRRWAEEAVMRTMDVVLAFPALLVLMVLASTGRRDVVSLVVTAAVLQLPPVTRIVRAAASRPETRTVVEALRLQGQPWWRIHLGYVTRVVLGPVVTDLGVRLGKVLYLLASVNFLGLGLPSSSPDWAVLVEQNSAALFTQPAAALVPAGLLTCLCVGANLTADRMLQRRRDGQMLQRRRDGRMLQRRRDGRMLQRRRRDGAWS